MKRTISSLIIKVCILLGAFFLGLAARTHAQSPSQNQTGNQSDTTHHHYGMHRGWGNRPGSDSLAKHDGFHRGQGGFRDGRGGNGQGWGRGQDGWASRGDHHHGFGRGQRGGWAHRGGIHYTPDQRKQLMAINKEYKQKSEALFAQDNITLKQYKAGLIALQKDKKTKLAALLTPQQKNEMAERRKRMTENAQVMEVARLERLRLHLNLTDDQVAKLKAGQETIRNQAKVIHENDNLLPQEKREQMKAIFAKRNDTYKSVLTPEQYTQFEKMHRRPGGFGGPGSGGAARI
jgi:Spy/CpxP family protein refolding chaperone